MYMRIRFMSLRIVIVMLSAAMLACAPKEQVVLRTVNINRAEPGQDGQMTLYADAIFYNHNSMGMKLKHIDIKVSVDGKETAHIDHDLQLAIKPKSEFKVPIEAKLKSMGLLDTILGILGGKEHEIEFAGSIRIKVKGFPVRVPVTHKERLKL